MIRRTTKIQLALFLVLSLLGVSYVGFNYVGLGATLFGPGGCTISANFPDSGGIFTNAEVTYRGVTVGRVGELHLSDYTGTDGQPVRGVRVDLRLTSCSRAKIPADAQAYVSDRSAVGEQYVNLEPASTAGPFVTGGALLSKPGRVPVATQVLLQNLDDLLSHIDSAKLNTVISELGTAFAGRGPALQQLLDAGDQLLASAQAALPETLKLIDNSQTVLKTQLDSGSAIKSWARSLNLLTAQLKASDGDVRSLLTNGPDELNAVTGFINSNRSDLDLLFANLVSLNPIFRNRLQGIDTILLLYPNAVAGGFTVVPGDGTAHFGLVVNFNDPKVCTNGYQGTTKRQSSDTGPTGVNTNARCAEPRGSTTSVRGAQNVPGGDPISTTGGGSVYPRSVPGPATGTTIPIGGSSSASSVLGDNSWLPLLTSPLH